MRFEIHKNTKRGFDCFERLGNLYHENELKSLTRTPTCTTVLSAGI
jgi:hypothetical protein